MKRSIKAVFAALTVISIVFSVLPCCFFNRVKAVASEKFDTRMLAESILSFIEEKTNSTDVQGIVDKASKEEGMYDWYVMGLLQSNINADFSKYFEDIAVPEKTEKANAVELLRRALILCANDPQNEFVTTVLNEQTNKMGIMSNVFALHVLNNGGSSSKYSPEKVIESILEKECKDGGWALNAHVPDADVTAMTLQCLAPYYGKNENAAKAIDRALTVLSLMQNDKGGFTSFGNENSESICQVIIALCSLGISPLEDSRFIKNGKTTLDALCAFKLSDGSFEHIKGKGYNFKATEQAFLAFTALNRLSGNNTPLFVLDTHDSKNSTFQSIFNRITQKPLVLTVLIVGLLFLATALLCSKKKKRKLSNIFIALFAVSLLGAFLLNTEFSSPSDYYTVTDATGTETVTAKLSISCKTVKEYAKEKDYIPASGEILPLTQITLTEKSTVYDFLVYAAKKYGIQIENSSYAGNSSAYISSIGYIKEFDFGNMSGWMFTVNGKTADVGCGEYEIKQGDIIQWFYTCSLGEDIK